jgi:hypothetical protein
MKSRRAQGSHQRFRMKSRHRLITDHRRPAQGQPGRQHRFSGTRQQSVLDKHIIRTIRQIHMNLGHALSMKHRPPMSIPDAFPFATAALKSAL